MQIGLTKMGPCQLSHGHQIHMQPLLIGALEQSDLLKLAIHYNL